MSILITGIGTIGKTKAPDEGKFAWGCFVNGANKLYSSNNFGASFGAFGGSFEVSISNFFGISADGKYIATFLNGGSYWGYGVYVSSDYGASWTKTLTTTGTQFVRGAMSGSGQYLTMRYWDSSNYGSGFYISSDYGANWSWVDGLGYMTGGDGCMSYNGQYQYFLLGNGWLAKSTNYGASFSLSWAVDGYHVQCNDSGSMLVKSYGGDSNLWWSPDYGVNWYNWVSGAEPGQWLTAGINSTGQYVVAALSAGDETSNSPIYRSTNYMSSVEYGNIYMSGLWPSVVRLSKNGNIILIASSDTGIIRSTNFGSSWATVQSDGYAQGGLVLSSGT